MVKTEWNHQQLRAETFSVAQKSSENILNATEPEDVAVVSP